MKGGPKEEHGGNGGSPAPATSPQVATNVPLERLLELDRQIHSWPADFGINPKLARQLERRARAVPEGHAIDWAHAEALALASVLTEGVPVRMTGQDVERGTFSQRHLVLHDVKTGAEYTPMAHLLEATAAFKLYNSPLSELAVVGFEYGYSVAEPDTLVIWEAQFGDFANGAQVIIDQFISAGHAKWNQESRLVLLLPHGAEGQGPEHTSARLERFLQLAAEGELTVADCSTPAQYFHLLRRQILSPRRRPLIVMTPKSLLRHPRATSLAADLAEGSFQPVLDDAEARGRAEQVRKAVLCTGKFYYDLVTAEARDKAQDTAIVRVEELYPFPARALAQVLGSYPALETVVWAQEEPQNMGAGPYMEAHLPRVLPEGVRLGYAGRPERAAPAEGYASSYAREQARVVQTVFAAVTDGAKAPARKREPQKKG